MIEGKKVVGMGIEQFPVIGSEYDIRVAIQVQGMQSIKDLTYEAIHKVNFSIVELIEPFHGFFIPAGGQAKEPAAGKIVARIAEVRIGVGFEEVILRRRVVGRVWLQKVDVEKKWL